MLVYSLVDSMVPCARIGSLRLRLLNTVPGPRWHISKLFSNLSGMMETGTDHEGFKIPSTVPQDILLIQDLIGPIIPSTQPLTPDDSVDSSGESTDSAEEVEANLLVVGGKSTRSVSYFMHLTP